MPSSLLCESMAGSKRWLELFRNNINYRELTQPLEYDYDYVNGRLKGLGLIVVVIVSLNVGLR